MAVTLVGIIVLSHPAINVLSSVLIIALQFSRESYTELLSSTRIDTSSWQPSKAPWPMLVTDDGIVIDVSFSQEEKALLPILVTVDGIVIDRSPLHPEKVLSPIEVTPSDIVKVVRPEQEMNASFPKLVTVDGMVNDFKS